MKIRNLLSLCLFVLICFTANVFAGDPQLFHAPSLLSTSFNINNYQTTSPNKDVLTKSNAEGSPQQNKQEDKNASKKDVDHNQSFDGSSNRQNQFFLPTMQFYQSLNLPPLSPTSVPMPPLSTGKDIAEEVRKINLNKINSDAEKNRAIKNIGSSIAGPTKNNNANNKDGNNYKNNDIKNKKQNIKNNDGTHDTYNPAHQINNKSYDPSRDGCNQGNDLNSILSRDCVAALKVIDSANVHIEKAPISPVSILPLGQILSSDNETGDHVIEKQYVQCVVAIFPSSGNSAPPTSFQTEDIRQCIQMSTDMSYRIPSISNITVKDPAFGVIGITCHRDTPDGTKIVCNKQ